MSTATPLEPGTRLGSYVICQLLADGGMGSVYLAEDMHGDPVAIKVLGPSVADDEAARRRFVREGEVLGRLDHPNVVRLLDRGEGDDGRPFMVIEYVPGNDLGAVVERCPGQRLSPPEAAFVVERCARALARAHEAGILHRDVKPSNVLVTRDGQVKLTDFGVALTKDDSVRLTARDHVMGTLPYLAPEILGDGDWTAKGDVYGLGCMAMRLLTSETPYPYRTVKEVIEAHRSEEPPRLRSRLPDAPEALDALLARMLDKSPGNRPTAQAVADTLANLGLGHDTTRVALEWSEGRVGIKTFKQNLPVSGGHLPAGLLDAPTQATGVATAPVESGLVGAYRLREKIGAGGAGEVWLATHVETQREVAVKLLDAKFLTDGPALGRFEREVESLVKLGDHPAIVGPIDRGRTGGRPWYAMELVTGRSLRVAMKEGLPLERALDALEIVAGALGHAHSRGVVHRDVKPENILLADDGKVRLVDFGLVRALSPDAEALTVTGEVVGTAAYMAPEQVDADLGPVGPAADVYALGAVLYELLTGVSAHRGDTAVEVYTRLLAGEGVVPVRTLAPRVDRGLEQVCTWSLERRPGDRPPDGRAFNDALRAARLASEADLVASQRLVYPLRLLAFASLLVAGLAVTWAAVRERRAQSGDDPMARLQAVAEVGEPTAAVLAAEDALAASPGDAQVATQVSDLLLLARRRAVERAWAKGDLARAASVLGPPAGAAAACPPLVPEAAWIHAAAGDPHAALLCLGEDAPPAAVARLSAWVGDGPGLAAALARLPAARARALAHELRTFVPSTADAARDARAEATPAWALALEAGEAALADGAVGLAAIAFDDAAQAADALGPREPDRPAAVVDARLGLARVALARGDGPGAAREAQSALAAAAHPFDRARALALEALGRAVGGEPATERARIGAPAVPEARRALDGPNVGAGGSRAGLDVRGATIVERARALAFAGQVAEARALLAAALPRGDEATPGGSFVALERGACWAGLDGAPGLLLVRATNLARAARAGASPPAASAALALLERAARAAPGSPAVALATAEAALAAADLPRARAAADRAVALSPGDACALEVRAEVLRAAAAEAARPFDEAAVARRTAAREGPAGGTPPTSTATAPPPPRADALGRALEAARAELTRSTEASLAAAREALAAADGPRTRLAVAAAELEGARRRGEPLPGPTTPIVAGLLAPLLTGVDAAALVRARTDLATALLDRDPVATDRAELALARAAGPPEGRAAAAAALRLRAAAGAPTGADDARAALGLSGDLPARALLWLRRAEARTDAADRRRAFTAARALLPDAPVVELAVALDAGAWTRSADSVRALGRVVGGSPALADAAILTLFAGPTPDAAEARRLAASVGADRPEYHLGAALVLLVAARGATPEQADALGREAVHSALAAGPGPGADLTLALALGAVGRGARGDPCDPRVAPELAAAVERACAAAPWASSTRRAALHLGAAPAGSDLERVDALVATGFTTNLDGVELRPDGRASSPAVRRQIEAALSGLEVHLTKLDLTDPAFALAVMKLLDEHGRLPRLSLSLRLHLTAHGDAPGQLLGADPAPVVRALGGLSLEPSQRLTLLGQLELELGRDGGQRERAPRAAGFAVRALAAAVPASSDGLDADPLPAWVLLDRAAHLAGQPAEVRAALGRALPAAPALAEAFEHRARGETAALILLAQALDEAGAQGEGRLLDPAELVAPWSRSTAVLAAPRRGDVAARAAGWWGAEGQWLEVRLALDRAAAFGEGPSAAGLLVAMVEKLLLEGSPWSGDEAARAQAWRALGSAAEEALAWPTDPLTRAGLRGIHADSRLESAGRTKNDEERYTLLAQAREDVDAADAWSAGRYAPEAAWRAVRAAGAQGDLVAARAALVDLKSALEGPGAADARARLRKAAATDPWRARLEAALPEYKKLLGS